MGFLKKVRHSTHHHGKRLRKRRFGAKHRAKHHGKHRRRAGRHMGRRHLGGKLVRHVYKRKRHEMVNIHHTGKPRHPGHHRHRGRRRAHHKANAERVRLPHTTAHEHHVGAKNKAKHIKKQDKEEKESMNKMLFVGVAVAGAGAYFLTRR